jgi:HK97 family phage major capsid protein
MPEYLIHLEAAKVICQKAEGENRDFTAEEQQQVSYHLAEAKRLKGPDTEAERNARQQMQDDAIREELRKLGVLDEGAGGGGQSGAKAGPWSQAFEKQIGRFGQKDLISPSGAVSVPGVIDGLAPLSDSPVETILQLIPTTGLGGTDAFSYLQETRREHNAATVPAGDRKPTSIYTVQRIDDRVRTIAHLSEPIPRSYLDDIPLLRQYLDQVLREGYILELEYQILSGNGAGENFTGIVNTALIQVQPFVTNILVTCRMAITDLETVPISGPFAFVFNPNDWEVFELLTEAGTGAFSLRDASQALPVDRARRRLWGQRVALSLGIDQGVGLLVDFNGSTKMWEREAVRVDWSEAFHVDPDAYDACDSTGFERNLVKFRCEGRAGFAVKRPAGVVLIDLEAGS